MKRRPGAPVWKSIRILLLLAVLLAVALHAWLDRIATQGWQEPLWVGLFPLNGDGGAATEEYMATLQPKDFAAIEDFFAREGKRYGLKLEQPVHVELYPRGSKLPPTLDPAAGPLAVAWWSLKLRWFAAQATEVPGRAPPRIRLFILYHDPATLERAPDSHGLQKGLVGIVHLFADPEMAGGNNIVIAHELLHTVGASDKYDLGSGALSAYQWDMPRSLAGVLVGPETAQEIRWTH